MLLELETRVIDLIEEFQKKRKPRREQMIEAFYTMRDELGRVPTLLELHLNGSFDGEQYRKEFGSYVGFLQAVGVLTDKEKAAYETYSNWIKEVERTSMSKSYKMVVLSYMLSRGVKEWTRAVTAEEVAPYFHEFYMSKEYRKKIDFSAKNTQALWKYDEKKVASLIAKMPMTKWAGSSKGLVSFDGERFGLRLRLMKEQRRRCISGQRKCVSTGCIGILRGRGRNVT